jgi:aminoglycoside 3-N-acetyltransferase
MQSKDGRLAGARSPVVSDPVALGAAERVDRWRTLTAEAIDTLVDAGALTSLGMRFVEGMARYGLNRGWTSRSRRARWKPRGSGLPNGGRDGTPEGTLDRPMRSQDHLTDPPRRLVTQNELLPDLLRLGVRKGQTLLVNGRVGSIGLEGGSASAVLSALLDAVGETGHIVVPTMTMENSVTSRAYRNLVANMSEDEVREHQQNMPGFDKVTTPSTSGRLGEALLSDPRATRSAHPQSSFSAIGPEAGHLMADHRLKSHLGEHSPLAKLYAMKASVLLLGVDYERCSAFHLAEYRYVEQPPTDKYRCVVLRRGRRQWITFKDVKLDDEDFAKIGADLELVHGGSVKPGNVGNAPCRLIPLVLAVDHAKQWMAQHRVQEP